MKIIVSKSNNEIVTRSFDENFVLILTKFFFTFRQKFTNREYDFNYFASSSIIEFNNSKFITIFFDFRNEILFFSNTSKLNIIFFRIFKSIRIIF